MTLAQTVKPNMVDFEHILRLQFHSLSPERSTGFTAHVRAFETDGQECFQNPPWAKQNTFEYSA